MSRGAALRLSFRQSCASCLWSGQTRLASGSLASQQFGQSSPAIRAVTELVSSQIAWKKGRVAAGRSDTVSVASGSVDASNRAASSRHSSSSARVRASKRTSGHGNVLKSAFTRGEALVLSPRQASEPEGEAPSEALRASLPGQESSRAAASSKDLSSRSEEKRQALLSPFRSHAMSAASRPRRSASLEHAASRQQHVLVAEDFDTTFGGRLKEVRASWEQWGDPTLPPSRTIVVFPSFSHGPHMAANRDDPSPGWWDSMVGPGRYIDTNRFRVVCPSILGSPYGSTSPTSLDPETGKQLRMDFPSITPADQARAHALLLDQLGLDRVHAVVGASLGGMQALQFASLFPDRLDRLAAIVSTPKTTPGSVALRRIQRQAIMADPGWHKGNYAELPGKAARGPEHGLRIARELGMVAYRSREEFDARFEWRASSDQVRPEDLTFEVESYLNYQGAKFANGSFDPNAYLILSKCMDLMDLANPYIQPGRTLADAARAIRAKSLFVGIKQDALTPASEMEALAGMMRADGRPRGDARFVQLDSWYGHDAFLKEFEAMGPLLQEHVEGGVEEALRREEVHTTGLSLP